MLIPRSEVIINREGDLTKKERIRAEKIPCALSSSMRNLLLDKKAISNPEKNAVNNRAEMIIGMVLKVL